MLALVSTMMFLPGELPETTSSPSTCMDPDFPSLWRTKVGYISQLCIWRKGSAVPKEAAMFIPDFSNDKSQDLIGCFHQDKLFFVPPFFTNEPTVKHGQDFSVLISRTFPLQKLWPISSLHCAWRAPQKTQTGPHRLYNVRLYY